MTGLCVADAPDASCLFILQDVLSCGVGCAWRAGVDSRVFPLWALSLLRKVWKRFWRHPDVENLSKYRKAPLNPAVGAQTNDGDAAKLHMREQTLLSVLFMICFFQGKIQPKKHLITVLKKKILVTHFPFFGGPYFFYSHGYKVTFLTATKLFKELLFWILHFPSVSLFYWPLA